VDAVIRRFLVLGKVQGVYFRHSARLEANRLAIHGFARNLPDGSVEVIAHGAALRVEQLRAWLGRGPPQARVDEVRELTPEDAQQLPQGFDIF
jgi:acylphosphatase